MRARTFGYWVFALVIGATLALAFLPAGKSATMLYFLTLAALLVGLKAISDRIPDPLDVNSSMPDDSENPWVVQRMLMEASDQYLPSGPRLTNDSTLYAALVMEEGAEMLEGLRSALETRCSANCQDRELFRDLAKTLWRITGQMEGASMEIRDRLKGASFSYTLADEEALPIFDGTVDLTVVNCGFALASGLDGAMGYMEVAGSNLSKANPTTGKIDKTPDGKWIKGPNYRQPNLAAVLRRCASET